MTIAQNSSIRYVALGDSYTIGEGAERHESWPSLMVNNLRESGIDIELIANPSVTGWTTKDLIEKELPVFDEANANFTTILIGVNDWVQEVSKEDFVKNLNTILDHVSKQLKQSRNIVLITIPDFSVTPDGPKYSKGRNISEGIEDFNSEIIRIAKERQITFADLFEVSKEMDGTPDLVAKDNLHPSSKTYKRWESVIRPVVERTILGSVR